MTRHQFGHHNAPNEVVGAERGGVEETQAQSQFPPLPTTTRHPSEQSGGLEVPSSNLGAPTDDSCGFARFVARNPRHTSGISVIAQRLRESRTTWRARTSAAGWSWGVSELPDGRCGLRWETRVGRRRFPCRLRTPLRRMCSDGTSTRGWPPSSYLAWRWSHLPRTSLSIPRALARRRVWRHPRS